MRKLAALLAPGDMILNHARMWCIVLNSTRAGVDLSLVTVLTFHQSGTIVPNVFGAWEQLQILT